MEAFGLLSKPFRLGGVLFDELSTPSERLSVAIASDDFREDDIVVCSYPRAGMHWVADIATSIVIAGGGGSSYHTQNNAAYLEASSDVAYRHKFGQDEARVLRACPSLEALAQLPSPRIILTHLPCHLLPSKIQQGKARLIYVYRDPRDMAVSLWDSIRSDADKLTSKAELSWPTVFECFLEGHVSYGSWADHFKGRQTLASARSMLFVHYEDLLKDLAGAVTRIAAYLGCALSDGDVQSIVKSQHRSSSTANPSKSFHSNGAPSGWQSTFTVAQCETFDLKLDAERERLDLDMPYWPHYQISVEDGLHPGLYKYQGVIFYDKPVPFSRLRDIHGYSGIRDDDVIIWTYPKAGTHWAGDISLKIVHNGDIEKVHSGAVDCIGLEIRRTLEGHSSFNMPSTLAELNQVDSPRVLITHLRFRMLPELVQQGKGRLIYVYRDPRDLALSMYSMRSRIVKDSGFTWDNFLSDYNRGRVPWGSWWEHFKDCELNRRRPNLLVLSYEDMKQNLVANVEKIANFLGKSLSKDTIQSIADSCSIEATKAVKPNSPFVRKGTTGDWKNRFTVLQSEQFDKQLEELKRRLNLEIPY